MYSTREDIKTLLEAHTFADNANLDDEPDIITNADAHPSSHSDNGLITLLSENLVSVYETFDYRAENYTVVIQVEYDGQTNDTKIKALLEEMTKAFHSNNQSSTRSYYIRINYSFNGLVKYGVINIVCTATKIWAVIS